MNYLFIDSTYGLAIGILEDDLSWLSFEKLSGQKISGIIQQKIHELLTKRHMKPNELSGVITVNGPGFYTGLRLSEGLADVFHFFNVPVYSFYSYEIPEWCGIQSGVWFTKAYRGEYFFHHWGTSKNGKNELLTSQEISTILPSFHEVFIHSDSSLDDVSRSLIKKPVQTLDLLESYPKEIFKHVLNHKLKRDAFYFRAPEDEFKVNP